MPCAHLLQLQYCTCTFPCGVTDLSKMNWQSSAMNGSRRVQPYEDPRWRLLCKINTGIAILDFHFALQSGFNPQRQIASPLYIGQRLCKENIYKQLQSVSTSKNIADGCWLSLWVLTRWVRGRDPRIHHNQFWNPSSICSCVTPYLVSVENEPLCNKRRIV